MPPSRQETDIFFSVLLQAGRETSSVIANVAKECAERTAHEEVIELVLGKDVSFIVLSGMGKKKSDLWSEPFLVET